MKRDYDYDEYDRSLYELERGTSLLESRLGAYWAKRRRLGWEEKRNA